MEPYCDQQRTVKELLGGTTDATLQVQLPNNEIVNVCESKTIKKSYP